LPRFVEALTWKQFKKVFYRDPQSGTLRGHNVRIEQGPLDAPWKPRMRRGEPVTFGRYRVVDTAGRHIPRGADGGLLIDYGPDNASFLSGLRFVRDPIVAVNEGDSQLLLGWSYLDLGFTRVGTPSFFSLERDQPLGQPAA
jgi:hypothetical protein